MLRYKSSTQKSLPLSRPQSNTAVVVQVSIISPLITSIQPVPTEPSDSNWRQIFISQKTALFTVTTATVFSACAQFFFIIDYKDWCDVRLQILSEGLSIVTVCLSALF